jgi:hypothetical protein
MRSGRCRNRVTSGAPKQLVAQRQIARVAIRELERPDAIRAVRRVEVRETRANVGQMADLGRFMGVEPTGRHVKARGVQMIRFENGRAVERWGLR